MIPRALPWRLGGRRQSAPPAPTLKPLAVSASARALLARGPAKIEALHRHGVTISVAGESDSIFMNTPGSGLLPLQLIVRTRELERLRAVHEAREAADDSDVSLHIDLRTAHGFSPHLDRPIPRALDDAVKANIDAVAQCLRAQPLAGGLGQTAAVVLASDGRLRALLAALRAGRTDGLTALIGRGLGSTPAGDDLLIGALVHAWAFEGENSRLIAAVNSLAPELNRLTTRTGATYLRAAVRGEFGSHLITWVRALPWAQAAQSLALADRVAGHGATSGADTLMGFIGAAEDARAAGIA